MATPDHANARTSASNRRTEILITSPYNLSFRTNANAVDWRDLVICPAVILQQFSAVRKERIQVWICGAYDVAIGLFSQRQIGIEVHCFVIPIRFFENNILEIAVRDTDRLGPP